MHFQELVVLPVLFVLSLIVFSIDSYNFHMFRFLLELDPEL